MYVLREPGLHDARCRRRRRTSTSASSRLRSSRTSRRAPNASQSFLGPLVNFAGDRRYTLPLLVVLLALPALAAYRVYANANVPVEPPFFARTGAPAHRRPRSPSTTRRSTWSAATTRSATSSRAIPRRSRSTSRTARATYYKQCFFCHADALGGDGMYAHGLNPAPANFIDQGVLPNFQETFFFWRIAKGGPGMPDEGGPGDSAMPEWERFLSNEEMWRSSSSSTTTPATGRALVKSMARSTEMRIAALLPRDAAALAPRRAGVGRARPRRATRSVPPARSSTRGTARQCHGDKGDGNGVAAPHLQPRPRDFTSGKFKIRTTPSGKLPDRRRPAAHHPGRDAVQLDAGVAAPLDVGDRQPRRIT